VLCLVVIPLIESNHTVIMSLFVSILIPCYNAERWIAHAIDSALAQTWNEKEVIVVDDGSTDSSLDVIRGFRDRIRWETGPNRGGGAARNWLLELAHGQWIQYLDADDYLFPNKIAAQVEFVIAYPDLDVVFGPVTVEHYSGHTTQRELLAIPEPHDLWVLLASWRLPQTGSPLWRKQAIVDVGGWKPDQPCCQEHELYLRLLIQAKRFAYHPTNGAVYRQWSTETLCKRDISEVHRQRLEIEQRLEDYLRQSNQLSRERLHAINQARFQIARSLWQYDTNFAKTVMRQVQILDPKFSPRGAAAPAHYRLAFHSLGFETTERLAAVVRDLISSASSAESQSNSTHVS
jgi:glycosyltransferase involved in cell wall biosynthesis